MSEIPDTRGVAIETPSKYSARDRALVQALAEIKDSYDPDNPDTAIVDGAIDRIDALLARCAGLEHRERVNADVHTRLNAALNDVAHRTEERDDYCRQLGEEKDKNADLRAQLATRHEDSEWSAIGQEWEEWFAKKYDDQSFRELRRRMIDLDNGRGIPHAEVLERLGAARLAQGGTHE